MVQLLQDDKDFMVSLDELMDLSESDIPTANFAMRELDEVHVERLFNSDFTQWPSIGVSKIVNDSGKMGYVVWDGYHRREAVKRKGLTSIKARSKTFEQPLHIVEALFRANLKHGLPLSQQKLYDYCYWLSVQYPNLTQMEIANRVGVNQSTVHRAIEKAMHEQRIALKEEAEKTGDDEALRKIEMEEIAKTSKKLVRFLKDYRIKNLPKFTSETEAIAYFQQFLKSTEDRENLVYMANFLLTIANVPVANTGKHTTLKQFMHS